ncbi:MAG: histidine phosphatase family protein [Bifidobacteriaceae bacterium]|jgi:phosphohistidine phosphatase|nr:histidine phosphatase family protein [Bifidobacteriaceae bacterium]
MSYNLFLIRHSKTEHPGLRPDFEREITHIGVEKAEELGSKLAGIISDGSNNIDPIDYFLCSDAIRATKTAEIIATKLDYNLDEIIDTHLLYEGESNEIIEAINSLSSNKTVVIVGHEPIISRLASFFANPETSKEIAYNMVRIGMSAPSVSWLQSEDLPISQWEKDSVKLVDLL